MMASGHALPSLPCLFDVRLKKERRRGLKANRGNEEVPHLFHAVSWVTANGPTDNLNELANMLCAKILMQAIEYKDAGAAAGCWEPKDHEGLPLGRRAHGDPHGDRSVRGQEAVRGPIGREPGHVVR